MQQPSISLWMCIWANSQGNPVQVFLKEEKARCQQASSSFLYSMKPHTFPKHSNCQRLNVNISGYSSKIGKLKQFLI